MRLVCPLLLLLLALLLALLQWGREDEDDDGPGGGNKNIFCLLCRTPHEDWLQFLRTELSPWYVVKVVVDDNDARLDEYEARFGPEIEFVRYDDAACERAGYWDANYTFPKRVTSWDKALFHFSAATAATRTKEQKVWFCEDDVFIRSAAILRAVDEEHPETDLLCSALENENKRHEKSLLYSDLGNNECPDWCHWPKARESFPPPWVGGLMCICRMSASLLAEIHAFALQHRKLQFLEVLFPTVAYQSRLSILVPPQMGDMHWYPIAPSAYRARITNKDRLYHAVKTQADHAKLRTLL